MEYSTDTLYYRSGLGCIRTQENQSCYEVGWGEAKSFKTAPDIKAWCFQWPFSYHRWGFMSLSWKRNGEEVGSCPLGYAALWTASGRGSDQALPLKAFWKIGFRMRLYHMSPSPPWHDMTDLHKHVIHESCVAVYQEILPHCPPITPTSVPEQLPKHHSNQCCHPAGNGAMELLVESARKQLCILWHAWGSFSGYSFWFCRKDL